MATQKSNAIKFPQPTNPERKEDVRIGEQFLEKVDGIVIKGLRRDLAAAGASVLMADAGAAEDVEFSCLSIKRRLRARGAVRSDVIAKYYREICPLAGRA